MIKYRLNCRHGHDFEAWFAGSDAFDAQSRKAQVVCPACGSTEVAKAIMAPNVATRGPAGREPDRTVGGRTIPAAALRVLSEMRQEVERHADYVGLAFAEEARRIHHEEVPPRRIYGEASLADVKELVEDGVPVLPLPRLPKDEN